MSRKLGSRLLLLIQRPGRSLWWRALGFLPIALAAAMYVINRPYISTLFTTHAGNVMLGGAVVLAGIGFYWMKKTIEIEI